MKLILKALFCLSVVLTGIAIYTGAYKIRGAAMQSIDNLPDFDLNSAPGYWGAMVRLFDPKNGTFCSGTVISDRYILTAAHCLTKDTWLRIGTLKSDNKFTVESSPDKYGNRGYSLGSPVAVNILNDYGLIVGDFRGFRKLRLDSTPESVLKIDPKVTFTCGYPQASTGICYKMSGDTMFFGFMVMAHGMLFRGMSGGPVYNAATKEVVGVNSAVWNNYIVISPLVGLFESFNIRVVGGTK